MIERRTHHGRRGVAIENAGVRVTVLEGGGHIAEILDKKSGINPLWTPKWPSMEPADFDRARHREYGAGAEARLLAGIMGHNICLDFFGGPTDEEAAAGLTVHGEAPVASYSIDKADGGLLTRADLPLAQLRFERRIDLHDFHVRIRETVENLSSHDRPVGWTQHATLGPPFLEKGVTQFRASATRSFVFAHPFGDDDYLARGAEFDWPHAPRADGGSADLQIFSGLPRSSAYTAHVMDPSRAHAWFVAFSPGAKLAIGYVWRRADFPWMGIWEENLSRTNAPWNGAEITRGMEFGVSPIPETRRQMIERGRLFGTPTFKWIPARAKVHVEYFVALQHTAAVPETLEWPESRAGARHLH
jgi:hypothetical protein